MRTFTGGFATGRLAKTGSTVTWVLAVNLASDGLIVMSDIVTTWNSVTTKDWVLRWGQINMDMAGQIGAPIISDLYIDLLNDPNSSPSILTMFEDSDNSAESASASIYLMINGSYYEMWRGNVDDYEATDELTVRIHLVGLYRKYDKYVGTILSTTDYAGLDPADTGKTANILYGALERVPCHCIDSGAASALTADMTASSPTNGQWFYVNDASRFPAGASIVQIDAEKISIQERSANGLKLAASGARGYGGTTAAAHVTGAQVFESKTEYVYLLADHPVHSIGVVRVDGKVISSGVTLYTGQSGNEHASYAGKACIAIQHGVGITKRQLPTGTTGDFSNLANAIDANDSTYSGTTNTNKTCGITFAADSSIQVVTSQTVNCKLVFTQNGTGGYLLVETGFTPGTITSDYSGTRDFTKSGGRPEDSISFTTRVQVNNAMIYEVWYKEITYYPLGTGDTAARIWIGEQVSADCEGYQDNGSGDYSGTADELLEQPDHIMQHFLVTYGGLSFAEWYFADTATMASAGYTFGVVINERRTLKEWITKMAFECRCYFYFWINLAWLIWRPDSLSSDKTITADMIRASTDGRSSLHKSRTPVTELINKIDAKYGRSWIDGTYGGVYSISDSTAITRYGQREQPDLFLFDFITDSGMAEEVADFYLDRYKDRKTMVSMDLLLDNLELMFTDVVTITPLSAWVGEIVNVNYTPGSGQNGTIDSITVTAKEY